MCFTFMNNKQVMMKYFYIILSYNIEYNKMKQIVMKCTLLND